MKIRILVAIITFISAFSMVTPTMTMHEEEGKQTDTRIEFKEMLLCTAIRNGQIESVREILATDPSIVLNTNQPLIVNALEAGHNAIALLLIDGNANLQQANENGFTPLMVAEIEHNAAILEALAQHGLADYPEEAPKTATEKALFVRLFDKMIEWAVKTACEPLFFSRL